MYLKNLNSDIGQYIQDYQNIYFYCIKMDK